MNTESLYEREDHSGMYTKKLAKSKNKQNGEKINAKKETRKKKNGRGEIHLGLMISLLGYPTFRMFSNDKFSYFIIAEYHQSKWNRT